MSGAYFNTKEADKAARDGGSKRARARKARLEAALALREGWTPEQLKEEAEALAAEIAAFLAANKQTIGPPAGGRNELRFPAKAVHSDA